MEIIRKLLRPLSPQFILNWYHLAQSIYYNAKYKRPSNEMIIIGVTGSKGKTTTSNMIWAVLSATGAKVGQTGTANFRIGNHEELNKFHMTMPGPAILQKYLRKMADEGCEYVVIETPSEGQAQYRHVGINYDVLVFTNLTEEILPIHRNKIEVLRKHNAKVFEHLETSKRKTFDNKQIPKISIINNDAADSKYYADFAADKHISFSVDKPSDYNAQNITTSKTGTSFVINGASYNLPILGEFNVINAAGAVAVASELDIAQDDVKKGLASLKIIPGRMEKIDEGQNFTVIVDYAHEQVGMKLLLESAQKLKGKDGKIIIHLGAEGGGRDKKKRPEMGAIAACGADYVIIGNVDPYDDDPKEIIDEVANGARRSGKVDNKDLFCITDRRDGIKKALELASSGDLVLITGKGAEQSYIEGGKKTPWDDREVVRAELKELTK